MSQEVKHVIMMTEYGLLALIFVTKEIIFTMVEMVELQDLKKNNLLICTSDDCSNDFYNNVISNKKLKNDFTYGNRTKNRCGITKEDFF